MGGWEASVDGWRIQVDQLIAQQQPFHLVYQGGQGQTLEDTVRCAVWRGRLDTVRVELCLTGGLTRAYEQKEDVHDEVIGDVRRIVRTVANPFWLMRDVRRYGAECTIVSPLAVRDRFKQELFAIVEQYTQ